MARLIKTVKSDSGLKMAKIYHDSHWGEFVVTFWIAPEHGNLERVHDADYFTNCPKDAMDTVTHYCKEE